MTCLRRARPLLGTLVEIAIDDDRVPPVAQQAIDRAFAAIERVHVLMSYHDAESEVSRINREAASRAVTVSEETWAVLTAARRYSETSDGLFDITIAPTLARAGFLPRHADHPRASGHGNWRDVELLSGRRVRLARRLRIDLGGVAKGYAVDQAVESLRASGVRTGRVNAGGDLRILGGRPQTLHVRHPGRPTALLPLARSHNAAATSAGYFQNRRSGGQEVCAIAHPGTRRFCDARRSVTVFADDCMTADALTKVIHVDPARGDAVLSRYCARAVVLEFDAGSGDCRLYDSASRPRDRGVRVQST